VSQTIEGPATASPTFAESWRAPSRRVRCA